MFLSSRIPAPARRALAALWLLALLPPPALADTAEPEGLAAILRQLDRIDRQIGHTARAAPSERARYHFDYLRLREDLLRVRTGIKDYLAPPRAQPRDLVDLAGDYRRAAPAAKKEATP
jgi:RAQPRD family integrative conjugative element protein